VTEIPLRLPKLQEEIAPPSGVPDEVEDAEDIQEINPASAARITRASFGLSPDTSIGNLIYEIEQAGILVLAMPVAVPGIDAFSLWARTDARKPLIVVSSDAPGDRLRLSIAHELGHLVMHRAPEGTLAFIEKQANQFAAEFLLPEAAIREEIVPPVTLTSLAHLKPRWKVSIQALVMRARELRIISEYQYRYLFEQLSAYGWRTREPSNLDVAVERPRFIHQVAEMIYGRPLDYQQMAADLLVPVALLKEIIEAYAGVDEPKPQVSATDDTSGKQDNIVQFPKRS
jgi:Zn-dependent peptidase ImmA (M78 family)